MPAENEFVPNYLLPDITADLWSKDQDNYCQHFNCTLDHNQYLLKQYKRTDIKRNTQLSLWLHY